jgi:hypothetical protein
MRNGLSNTKPEGNGEKSRKLGQATSLFFAIVYGLFLLLPVRSWATIKVDLSTTFPHIPFQDSGYYLGQIEGFRSGARGFGNPFYFEHSNDGFGNGSSALFALWGLIGRFLNFDILQTYLFTTLATGILTALSVGLYFRTVTKKHYLGIFAPASIVFIVCGTELGRPSPTQLGLWIVFILLWLQMKVADDSRRNTVNAILYVVVLMFLTFANPFYSLFIGICHLLFILRQAYSQKPIWLAKQLLLLFMSFVPFGLRYLTKFEHEKSQSERFGIIHSHLPGSFKLTFFLCITISMIYFLTKDKDKDYWAVMVMLTSNLITLNSQVFTGVHYEMESHLRLLTMICLMIACSYLIAVHSKFLISYALIFFLAINATSLTSLVSLFSEPDLRSSQTELKILNSVANEAKIGDVLLYKDLNIPIESQEMIGVLTSTNLYFNPGGNLSRAADKEILERMACSLFINQGDLNGGLSQAYLHRFQNERLMFSKWDSLLNRFGIDLYNPDLETSARATDLQFVIEYQRTNCSDPLNFNYKIDFIVDENLELVKLSEYRIRP